MKILIIGGSRFVGKHLVDAALAHGHDVTTFNRGKSEATPPAGVEALRGDRDGQLDALKGRTWDAVFDTCGFVPRVVKQSAELLKDAVGQYVFISSLSVYSGFEPDSDETAALETVEDKASEDVAAHYGALKALCEQTIEAEFPGRSAHLRAGLIIGPNDYANRFPYWMKRLPQGGEVLAPGKPEALVQVIDSRDIAEWGMHLVENNINGVFNTTGPEQPIPAGKLLATLVNTLNAGVQLTWVSDEFLIEEQLAPLDGIPFWLPAEYDGFFQRNIDRALAAGLKFRPLAETAADTAQWLKSKPEPKASSSGIKIESGLTPEQEAELLAKWRSRAGS